MSYGFIASESAQCAGREINIFEDWIHCFIASESSQCAGPGILEKSLGFSFIASESAQCAGLISGCMTFWLAVSSPLNRLNARDDERAHFGYEVWFHRL